MDGKAPLDLRLRGAGTAGPYIKVHPLRTHKAKKGKKLTLALCRPQGQRRAKDNVRAGPHGPRFCAQARARLPSIRARGGEYGG